MTSNRSGKKRYLCLVPALRRKTCNQSFTIKYNAGYRFFLVEVLYQGKKKKIPSYSQLVESCYHE